MPADKPPLTLPGLHALVVIVVGDRVWGKGLTAEDAVAAMKKAGGSRRYQIYVGHADTRVTEDGSFAFPPGWHPKYVGRK